MKQFEYQCNDCGETHIGAPSFSFVSPYYYNCLNEDDKRKCKLSSDLCNVLDTDYFIRVVLEIPIIDYNETFMWGIWVSQSLDNFKYYVDKYEEDLTGHGTFGWFSNRLPYYEDTLGLKCDVIFHDKGRPAIHLQQNDHELVKDFHNGITMEKAIKIAQIAMHGNN